MKAIYPTLSHSVLLLIGLIAMSLILFSIYSFISDLEKDTSYLYLNYIADSTKNKILEVYSLANQSSDYSKGAFQLSLPEKIGNRRYTITFYQNDLVVSVPLRSDIIEVSRQLKINATLSGTSYLPATLEIEKQNGDIYINLVG